ncbi:MAG: hypothetical protein ACWGSD_06220, partial [Thermodesulfobacteriota bacterium]
KETSEDLFQRAEEDAEKISQRMQREKTETRKASQQEIVESENQNRARAIQKYRALLGDKNRLDPATLEASMLNLAHLIFEQCLAGYRDEMRAYDDAYRQYQLGSRAPSPRRCLDTIFRLPGKRTTPFSRPSLIRSIEPR